MMYPIAKACLDVVLAALALVVLAPVIAIIALAIWAQDPGAPVLFHQRRCGLGGRPFELLKFRTMVRDAEALKESLREQSVVACPAFRLPNDPRVTRLGRFLRRSSLDELPQLVNVLTGDMTLVGPRPVTRREWDDFYQENAPYVFRNRPGLTGLWQVSGRSLLSYE